MATALACCDQKVSTISRFSRSLGGEHWAIHMTMDLDADARRIFQALTVPEYIEAWILLPNQATDSLIQAAATENGYRLDYFAAGCNAVSITSSYVFRHQRKMRMSWKKMLEANWIESLVDLRLRGNFACSVLHLRHTGLGTFAEFDWHRRLWHRSLDRLASLLRSA